MNPLVVRDAEGSVRRMKASGTETAAMSELRTVDDGIRLRLQLW